MPCDVYIGREFRDIPKSVLDQLRRRLLAICGVLDQLEGSALMESLVQSTLAITIARWRFAYEFDRIRNRLVVVSAVTK